MSVVSKFPQRAKSDEIVKVVLTADLKRRLFEVAAAKGVSVSHFVREVVTEKVT